MMSEKMNVWVVKHGYAGRIWCRARVREAHTQTWRRGFVWAEWNDGPRSELANGAIVPQLPDRDDYDISNVDPLVFGPRMYFDYCRKGTERQPNELAQGDLVLFGCCKDSTVIIDTVFVIGEHRRWPTKTGVLPDWPAPIGALAERVHYHRYARQQHPEVYRAKLAARSYRGALDTSPARGSLFAWVPWKEELSDESRSLKVPSGSSAFKALQDIYPGKILLNGLRGGRYGVTSCDVRDGVRLFDSLRDLAREQGFGIAAELALESEESVPWSAQLARGCAPACGTRGPHAPPGASSEGRAQRSGSGTPCGPG